MNWRFVIQGCLTLIDQCYTPTFFPKNLARLLDTHIWHILLFANPKSMDCHLYVRPMIVQIWHGSQAINYFFVRHVQNETHACA